MNPENRTFSLGSLIAHCIGVLGFLLSVLSLLWQVRVHNESLFERALIRPSISFELSEKDFPLGKNDDDCWRSCKNVFFLNGPTFPAALPHGGRGGKQPGRPMTDSRTNSFDKPTADTKIRDMRMTCRG